MSPYLTHYIPQPGKEKKRKKKENYQPESGYFVKYYLLMKRNKLVNHTTCVRISVILLSEGSQTRKVFAVGFININLKKRQNSALVIEIKTLVSNGRVGIVWKQTWKNLKHQNGSGFYASFLFIRYEARVRSVC